MLSRVSKFQNKGRRNENVATPFIFGFLSFAIIIFLVVSNITIGKKGKDIESQIELLQNETEKLETQKQEQQSRIAQVQTEEYLEKVARERFNLKKPGEEAVVIIMPESRETPQEKPKKSFWQKFLEKFNF